MIEDDKSYTASQLILLAALDFPGEFTEADLTVQVWGKDPIRFGLPGYEHPDNNKVRINMMGTKGLITRGMIVKVANLTYRLSQLGKERAEAIIEEMKTNPKFPKSVKTVKLTDRQINLIKELRQKDAYRKHAFGMASAIDLKCTRTFYSGTSVIEVHSLMNQLDKMIEAQVPIKLEDGEEIGSEAIKRLRDCHTHLLKTHGGRLGETQKEDKP